MRCASEENKLIGCGVPFSHESQKNDVRISTYDSLDIGHYRALTSICSDIQGQTDAVEAHGGKQAHVCP